MKEYTERDHLLGKEPVVAVMYEKLVKQLKLFGDLRIEPKKTNIHISNRMVFAVVTGRITNIHLEVYLQRELLSRRVTKMVKTSTNSLHHTIRLESANEIDDELLGWLREAYNLTK
jgi:hypothetical protein